jgi:Tol biopolymer transport system component
MNRMKRSWRIILPILVVMLIVVALVASQISNLQGGTLRLGSGENTENTPEATSEATSEASAETGTETTPEATSETESLAQITPPSDLAFISNRAGTWDIYLLQSDGTLLNLTPEGTAQDYFASWALDGAQINFLANRLSADELGPSQVQADGSELRSLDIVSAILTLFSEQRFDWDANWSPDGTRILWSSLRDLNLELYTIPLDSDFTLNNATRLTSGGARDWFGSWSPDGASIAFNSDRNGNEDLFIVPAEGGDAVQLTDSEWDEIHPMFAWSGESIAYVYDEEDILLTGDINLWLMNPDGTDKRPLDEPFLGDPVWSPDGSVVALISNETSADNPDGLWQIYLHSADGERLGRISLPDGDYLFPVWRP